MNLPGRLRWTTLGDVLGKLYRAGVSGVLELVEAEGVRAGSAHRIYFVEGLIDGVETSLPAPRLGEVLSAQGVLPRPSLLELSRRLLRAPGARAGDVLVDAKLATPEAVLSGLRRQLRLRLDALFGIREAEVRFHARRPTPRASAGPRPLTPSEFLHGRPRARAARTRTTPASRAATPSKTALGAYRLLGVEPMASEQEVRRAFRRLAVRLHPDRHPNATPAERAEWLRRFAEVSAAYHTLTRRA